MIANRPTPESIAEAFPAYGIRPVLNSYLKILINGDCIGCAVGVMLARATGGQDAAVEMFCHNVVSALEALVKRTGLPRDYIAGIDQGFSSGGSHRDPRGWTPEYEAGVEDGIAVRRLVFPSEATP